MRGLKASDFPRVTRLAENVYAFEQIDPTKRTVTVNNLIVVTSGGVLIAESQGTADNVRRLVAEVARLTPQPIKYVVVGSEHGDHTGGIAAFPPGVVYLAHPFSAPRIKQPTEPVADKRVVTLGGTEIDVLFLGRAHTGGDLEVYLPQRKDPVHERSLLQPYLSVDGERLPDRMGGDAEAGRADGRRLLRAGPRLRRRRGRDA